MIEAPDGITPPREIALPQPHPLLHALLVAGFEETAVHRYNLKVWVLDIATGTNENRRQRSLDGPLPHLEPVWSPGFQMGRLLQPPEIALSRHLRQQCRDGRNQAGHRRSGRFCLAGLGCQRQVSLVPRFHGFRPEIAVARHDVLRSRRKLRPISGRPQEGRSQPAASRERRRQGRRHRPAGPMARRRAESGSDTPHPPHCRTPRAPVTVQIDFDGLQQRIIAVPGVPRASTLNSGPACPAPSITSSPQRADGGAPGAAVATLQRYRFSDRSAAPSLPVSSAYDVSADGHKLVYRTSAGGGGGRGRGGVQAPPAAPRSSWWMPISSRRRPDTGASKFLCACILDPKEEFKQIFDEGWRNQRDYLYVKNMHGADWPQDERDVRRRCCPPSCTAQT